MEEEPKPNLPRPSDDPERLRKLRDEARNRLDEEASRASYPAPVYGSPPPPPRRFWTMRGLLIAAITLVLGLLAWLFGKVIVPMPVYGGPPVQPPPVEQHPPAPVYGGPVPPQPSPDRGGK